MGYILTRMLLDSIEHEISLGNHARAAVLGEALTRVIAQYHIT